MRERGLKICLQCVDVPKTDFAKGVWHIDENVVSG